MKKFLLILTNSIVIISCDNNSNEQQEIVTQDNRFHALKERYPAIKSYGMSLLGANKDCSLTLWDVYNGGWDKRTQLGLTGSKNTDYVQEVSKEYYTHGIVINDTFYLNPDDGKYLNILSLQNEVWNRKKIEIGYLSTFCKSSDNELLVAKEEGTIARYSVDPWQLTESWKFDIPKTHIKKMIALKDCLIASICLHGIYQLDFKTSKSEKILSNFYDNFKIASNHLYLMAYYREFHNLNIPSINELRIFNLSQKKFLGIAKDTYEIEWFVEDPKWQITDFEFFPDQNDLFIVLFGHITKQGCAIYSLSSRTKIARIHTDDPIGNVFYPTASEILLKLSNTFDALLVNKIALLKQYKKQQKETKKSEPLIVGKKNTVWSRMTEEEKDRLVFEI